MNIPVAMFHSSLTKAGGAMYNFPLNDLLSTDWRVCQ
jgi:hypothetical protein